MSDVDRLRHLAGVVTEARGKSVIHIDLYSGFAEWVSLGDFEEVRADGQLEEYEEVEGDGAIVYKGEEDMFVVVTR